jgi:hypothetical protein
MFSRQWPQSGIWRGHFTSYKLHMTVAELSDVDRFETRLGKAIEGSQLLIHPTLINNSFARHIIYNRRHAVDENVPVALITAVVVAEFSGQPPGQPIVLVAAVARNFIFGQWDLAPFLAWMPR